MKRRAEPSLQRGALYYHIKSKDDLLFGIMHRHIGEPIEVAKSISDEVGDPEGRLRQLARAFLNKLGHRRADVVLWQRETHALKGQHLRDLIAAATNMSSSGLPCSSGVSKPEPSSQLNRSWSRVRSAWSGKPIRGFVLVN